MDDIFSKVVAILIGCFTMFIVPMEIMSERQKNMEQTYIYTETVCFVDSICNKGILYSEAYDEFIKKLQRGNKVYSVKLKHTKYGKSENEEKIQISGQKESEESDGKAVYEDYTAQIISDFENCSNHTFNVGDIFRVEIIDKNQNPVLYYGGYIKDEDY